MEDEELVARDDLADAAVLGAPRAVLGALLGFHALSAARELTELGYFGDAFHMSLLPELLVPPRSVYVLALAARVCLGAMIVLGLWARPALALSAALGLWALLTDMVQFHHNRYALFLFAALFSLMPCDRSWTALDAPVRATRVGSFWAVRLAQAQLSLIYLGSGASKLVDADWRAGLVLADRVARHADAAVRAGVPRGLVDLLARADVSSALAKLAITTELVLVVAPWLKPARVVALWWGVWFHITIQLTSRVETFSILTVAMYALFATPDRGARVVRFDPRAFRGKLTAALVPLFDWLGRFELVPWEPDDAGGHSIVIVRRDGTRVTGIRALAMFARCLPVLFPLWAPLALVASFTKAGDLTVRA